MYSLIYSILDNNKNESFNFFIINKNIPADDLSELSESIKFNRNSQIIDCKINKKINDFLEKIPSLGWSKEIYYRLFISDFTKSKKILYLDCDMLVFSSLKELWNTKIDNYLFAAVEDSTLKDSKSKLVKASKYFNSGMLLINLQKWNQLKIKENCFKFLLNNSQFVTMPDQDALNFVSCGNWIEMDPKFNNQLNQNILSKNVKPVIVHFNGGDKPWKYESMNLYKKNYWFYRNKTKFRRYISSNFSLKSISKKVYDFVIGKIILRIFFKLKLIING